MIIVRLSNLFDNLVFLFACFFSSCRCYGLTKMASLGLGCLKLYSNIRIEQAREGYRLSFPLLETTDRNRIEWTGKFIIHDWKSFICLQTNVSKHAIKKPSFPWRSSSRPTPPAAAVWRWAYLSNQIRRYSPLICSEPLFNESGFHSLIFRRSFLPRKWAIASTDQIKPLNMAYREKACSCSWISRYPSVVHAEIRCRIFAFTFYEGEQYHATSV